MENLCPPGRDLSPHSRQPSAGGLGRLGSSSRLGHLLFGPQAAAQALAQVDCRGAAVTQATLLLKRRDRLRLAVGLGHGAWSPRRSQRRRAPSCEAVYSTWSCTYRVGRVSGAWSG